MSDLPKSRLPESHDREFFSFEDQRLDDLEVCPTFKEKLYIIRSRVTGQPVKHFILKDRSATRVMCTVTLIGKESGFEPRFKFWIEKKPREDEQPLIPLGELGSRTLKAVVDTSDGHENLWELIGFLQCLKGFSIPQQQRYSIIDRASKDLVSTLRSSDRKGALEAIRAALGSSLSDSDITLIANRKHQLVQFSSMLNDRHIIENMARARPTKDGEPAGIESVWQEFFENNPWIFGYGLNLIAFQEHADIRGKLERITTGAGIFVGAGKRTDALMLSRGYMSSLLLCEIKKHDTDLLCPRPYRKPDVYRPSDELVGSIAQIQKTAREAVRGISEAVKPLLEASGVYTGVEVGLSRPRQVVVIGDLRQLEENGRINPEKLENFELFRTSVKDTEVITFDELYARASFIVSDGRSTDAFSTSTDGA